MFYSWAQSTATGLMWILLVILFFGIVAAAFIAATMAFTNYQPQDVRRWWGKYRHKRHQEKARENGEEIPPEPDPDLVVVPALTATPGKVLEQHGRRICREPGCYDDLSTYWPHDLCMDHYVMQKTGYRASGRVAVEGKVTNRDGLPRRNYAD